MITLNFQNWFSRKISNLYNQIIPTSRPRIAIIGLPAFILLFSLADFQAKWLIQVWLGNVVLPSQEEMEILAAKRS